MKLYNYQVKNKEGKNIHGMIESVDERQAVSILREKGYFVLRITPKREFSLGSIFKVMEKASFGNIVEFTQQLSTMVTAGLPIAEALNLIRKQTRNVEMTRIINEIMDKVQGGSSLADAVANFPDKFSKVYIALIRAGEAAGVLDRVLQRLSDNLQKDREFKAKTKGAMVYPAIVISAMFVIGFIMMVFVIPKMMSFYKDFGATLPLPTRILMFISDVMVKGAPFYIVGGIAGFFLIRSWKNTRSGRRKYDEIIFSLPLIGKISKGVSLTEFSRTFALLTSAGIPILEGLNIVAQAVGNRVYQDGLEEAANEVEKGSPLGVVISRNPDFPPIVGQMVKVGEESGKMDEVLNKLANYFETETEILIKGLTTAIEPIIMIILGIGVGFLVFSVIIPMYNLIEAI